MSNVLSVDKGTWFDWIFGVPRLRLRIKTSKDKLIWVGKLDEWVEAVRGALLKIASQ